MENLLTILNRITTCGTAAGFTELCEQELSNIIGSDAADYWTADERSDFITFYTLFRTTTTAAFNVRDALKRENVNNLTTKLIKELKTDLYQLSSFEAGIELEDLAIALDHYIEILVNGDTGIDGTIAAIMGNYFRTFFLTLHSLEIGKRITITKFNHLVYEY